MRKLFFLIPMFLFACQSNEDEKANENSTHNTDDSEKVVAPEVVDEPMNLELARVSAEQIPDLDYEGNLVECLTWKDKNGQNYLIQTIADPIENAINEEGWETTDRYLYTYHYAVSEGTNTLLRELTDFIKGCEFDLIMNFIEEVELSDIDGDNYGEITFGYRINCTSDVSPSNQKVLIFENGDKYILRGVAVALGYGGEYESGTEFDAAPEGFLQKAENFWEENKVEFELQENEF